MATLLFFILFVVLAGVFYAFSVRSRRQYRCAECGESIRTEHMEATHCNTCGAPLGRPE